MTETLQHRAALDMTAAPPGDAPIAVLGSGLLHAALARSLGERCRHIEDLADDTPVAVEGCAALVVATDADDTRSYPALQRYAAQRSMPWLPVRVEAGWVLIGPAVLPPSPGARRVWRAAATATGRTARPARSCASSTAPRSPALRTS